MKLLIIAGFLGSGKTTLLLEVAKRLAAVAPGDRKTSIRAPGSRGISCSLTK
jgi:G3E family GTPase